MIAHHEKEVLTTDMDCDQCIYTIVLEIILALENEIK